MSKKDFKFGLFGLIFSACFIIPMAVMYYGTNL